jgi:hypothetical protein
MFELSVPIDGIESMGLRRATDITLSDNRI